MPLLHAGADVDFSAWYFEPQTVAGAFIALGVYVYAALTLPGASSWLRGASFVSGLVLMFLALVSPLDAAAGRLLSMHMLQHVFLTTIGPPLVLLGLTPALLAPLLAWRLLRGAAALLTHPVTAATLFIVNMWFWHVPPLYGAALDSDAVHGLMHLTFVATGVLFWWPVIQPTPDLPRYGEGSRILYLLATGMPMGLLALLFFASSDVIYDHYAHVETLWGIGPKDDQQVAGLVMGALGEAASFAAVTLLFFRLLDREEAQAPTPAPGRIDAG